MIFTVRNWCYKIDEHEVKEWTTRFKVGFAFLALQAYIMLAGICMYNAEVTKPDALVKTYWDAVWLLYMSATTVGFGDVSPISSVGKVLVILTVFVGVGLISYIGVSISNKITGFTETAVKNRELRTLLRKSIALDEEGNRLMREQIESNKRIEEKLDRILEGN